jgi:hypothetical protein
VSSVAYVRDLLEKSAANPNAFPPSGKRSDRKAGPVKVFPVIALEISRFLNDTKIKP